MLTKKPFLFDVNGDRDREDITDQYKHKEGTETERLSLYNAVRGSALAKTFYALPDPGLEDISFDLVELERIRLGENFAVEVHLKNRSEKSRTINAVLSAASIYYTGIKAKEVKKIKGTFILPPHSSNFFIINVSILNIFIKYYN